jgi:hypothetical protein
MPALVVPLDLRCTSRGEKMTNNRSPEAQSGGPAGTGIGQAGDPAFTVSERQQAVAIITTLEPAESAVAQISMFSSEEHPASPSPSPDSARDWMTRVATSCSPLVPLLNATAPVGWYGRTSPESCHLTEDGILAPSSGCWQNSGMGSPTEFSTLSTSEWTATLVPSHSDGAVCSLSDILETGAVPQRFYLSAKACQGILRRAEKRGKQLPHSLRRALEAVATSTTDAPDT